MSEAEMLDNALRRLDRMLRWCNFAIVVCALLIALGIGSIGGRALGWW